MKRVAAAIERGECVLALSGAMLSNADVMLGLKTRAALPSVALSGHAVAPVRSIDADSLLRAGGPNGIIVLVEPSMLDSAGIAAMGKVLKGYTNKPTVFVVDRNFNPLMFAAALPGIKFEHIKSRGKAFMKQLPMPPTDAALPEVAAVRPAKKKDRGLSAIFVGREDEVAAMNEALATGGPIVLVGPQGIGKRALIDNVLAESELTRLPDLTLGWDSGADTLWGRLALATKEAGSDALVTAISEQTTPVARIEATIAALTAAEGCADKVLVIHDAQHIFGKEGDFFRKSRVELLVRALLTNTYPLRVVFVSTVAPVLHRASDKSAMRVLTLEGLKGRFFHEIFEAYNAPEVERALFGPLTERLYGNPLAVIAAAIAVRNAEDPAALMAGKKFMNLASPDNLKLAQNVFKKRLNKLDKREQAAVARVCHLRQPVVAAVLVELGVEKKLRHKLLLEGLIQMSGKPGERTYGAHRVVQMIFSRRDVTQHDVMGHIAHVCRVDGERAEGVQKLALLSESIRYSVGARRFRELPELEVVNNDAITESLKGLLRSDKPRFDLAAERITSLLSIDAANSDVHLLKLEMLDRQNAKAGVWEAAAKEAMEKAPVPEIFHAVVNHYLRSRKGRKAASALEVGIAALPDEPRLLTRLGSLLLQEGRRPDAIKMFRTAMDLAPQLPDAYGLLGMARRDEGMEVIAECEELLREAVRLAPKDIVQTSRLVDLLLARARVELKEREALLKEANDLLDPLVKGDNKASRAQVLLSEVIRESGGDLERARWLLKTAGKKARRGTPIKSRIRLQNAMLDITEGKLDDAEAAIRALAEKDPTNHRIFLALSMALEARGQVIPAHAEMLRARDRSSANSLDRVAYQREIERIQALIESGITNIDYGLDDIIGDAKAPAAAPAAPRDNVVRRRPGRKAKAAATEE